MQLNPASTGVAGATFYGTAVPSAGLHATFTMVVNPAAGGGDGMTFALLDGSKPLPTAPGTIGGGLGWSGLGGTAIAFDEYQNTGDPGADFVGIATGVGPASDQLTYVASTRPGQHLTGGTHAVDVSYSGTQLTVAVDGSVVLTTAIVLPPNVFVGFTGSTGGVASSHTVATATITAGTATPPPGYALSLSLAPDRSTAVPLQGSTVTGSIYAFVAPATGIKQVRFYLDNAAATGTPRQTEFVAPYDLAGTAAAGTANPFNTAGLIAGSHTITAAIDKSAGGTDIVTSTLTVPAPPLP